MAVTITGSAEDGSTVNIKEGGSLLATGTATGGTFSITINGLPDGSHDLSVSATDAAGNEGQAAPITVIVVSLAPAAPTITWPKDGQIFGGLVAPKSRIQTGISGTDY